MEQDPESPSEANRHTLYINNINEKISLNKIKPVLERLFGRYGTVVQLTAHKNLKMKGQAFITYKNASSTATALRKLQGRPVFRKPIRITYAKNASDEENRLLGKVDVIDQRKEAKRQREEEKTKAEPKSTTPTTSALSKSQIKQWKSLPPHHILLLQNVQEDLLTTEFLEEKFSEQTGFERVRLIKFRKLAFIDFDVESNASKCLETVNAEIFGPDALFTYAKR